MYVIINNLSKLGLKLNHVSKRGLCSPVGDVYMGFHVKTNITPKAWGLCNTGYPSENMSNLAKVPITDVSVVKSFLNLEHGNIIAVLRKKLQRNSKTGLKFMEENDLEKFNF